MHELSTMIRLVSLAQETAEKEGAKKVTALTVKVGEMTGILPSYLYKYFPEASRGTLLEGAELTCTGVPVRVRCLSCGTEYEPDRIPGRVCPNCGKTAAHILAGRDVTLENIEIES